MEGKRVFSIRVHWGDRGRSVLEVYVRLAKSEDLKYWTRKNFAGRKKCRKTAKRRTLHLNNRVGALGGQH